MESGTPAPTVSQKRSIDQILQAGWYLLELINEILDLALIESGKLSLSLEPSSLAEVMRECQTMIEPQAQKRGIRVVFPRFESPSYVKGDRTRVKQVLINLLSNAIKYNRAGGSVVVDCSRETAAGRIRVSVTDTGAGLTPEPADAALPAVQSARTGGERRGRDGHRTRRVQAADRIDGRRHRRGKHGWEGQRVLDRIEADDRTGTVTSSIRPAPIPGDRKSTPTEACTLLYVEDNPANLMLVEDLIARRSDLRLLSARDGDRGIEIARAARPDVILMDINLPGMSGIAALRILADDPATAHIPVIALSANAIPRDIERGLQAGFFRYLTKPIKVAEFMDTLDVALKFAKTRTPGVVPEGQT